MEDTKVVYVLETCSRNEPELVWKLHSIWENNDEVRQFMKMLNDTGNEIIDCRITAQIVRTQRDIE